MGIQINGQTDTISAVDGSLSVSGADLTNLSQLTVTGVATFQGNVSIAGTLTYDDVTNVDSLGIVTARKGIRITNNTAAGAAGTIFSPADNVLAFGTNDLERVRIDSSGNIGVGTNNPQARLHLSSGTSTQLLISNTSSTMNSGDTMGTVDFTAGPSNTTNARISGLVVGTNESGGDVVFETRADGGSLSEKVRITSSGNAGIGTANPTSKLQVQGTIGLGASDDNETSFPGGRTKLTSTASGFFINHNNNSATIFQNQGVERVRVSATGHVGILSTLSIGTNTQVTSSTGFNPVITVGSATTSRLVWGTPGSNDYRLNLSGGGALVFGVDGDSENFAIEGHQTGVQHVKYFGIDNYGRVTTPYQPMAYVTYTGAALVRGTVIPFTAVTNQGNHWNNGSYVFTCPVAGIYHASLNMTGNSTQSDPVQTYIRKNGNNMAVSYYPGGPVSISILCAANDTIDFVYNHDNAGYNGGTPAYASVHLVG